jgi:hypothetical protein
VGEQTNHSERRGMLTGGLIVLGVGVLFLLHNLDIIPGMHVIWPVIPIIVGLALIVGGLQGGRRTRHRERPGRYGERVDPGRRTPQSEDEEA